MQQIIPYLCNDIPALIKTFAKTTMQFLTMEVVATAYYKIVFPQKYGCVKGFQLMHGCKHGTLTLKDARRLVHDFDCDTEFVSPHRGFNCYRGFNCLHVAAKHGHLDIVKFLVEDFDMNIDATDSAGNCAMFLSAYKGHANVVEYLLHYGENFSHLLMAKRSGERKNK